MLIAGLPW